MVAIDITDETFEAKVLAKSSEVTVVVELWAPGHASCEVLSPIVERMIDATDGKVMLAKVNIAENPGIGQAFKVRSIPAVYALKNGAVVNGFEGAIPEHEIQAFVDGLLPSADEQALEQLIAAGDEASLRLALQKEPANEEAIGILGELLVADGRPDEALALIERIPENDRTRKIAATARIGESPTDDYDTQLTALLDSVKADDDARQKFVDILELMGAEDPRTAAYRRKLTTRLY
ncbi:MAG: putative thioredoxin [Ilumatobacter sp.]|jgi:putative thioredoxin